MKKTIKNYLADLESQRDIKILLACETGSRAWGFPSTDSDYDVRVIYIHRHDWYLSLNEHKDSINLMLDDDLIDISGWDLRKSLRLLAKSNSALIERIQSPIIYQKNGACITVMKECAQACYARLTSIHHYFGLAKRMFFDLNDAKEIGDGYKLKSFFYVLRAACVCRWILQNDTMPHIEFAPAYQQTGVPAHLIERIEELVEFKATVNEHYRHVGEDELFDFIRDTLAEVDEKRQTLPGQRADWRQLDDFFINMVREYG